SIHMNANEVIAGRACEILGVARDRTDRIHPNDHVNLGQSTNDVVPTAIRLGGSVLGARLAAETETLAASFAERARAFDRVVKSGRTHLQDAVPIRLGQELGGYSLCLERRAERIGRAVIEVRELGIGGSAAGTGLNTHPDYAKTVVAELSTLYGITLRPAEDRFEAMQSHAPIVDLIGAARALAIELIRITNDLRLLASGPRTGLAEIRLPAVQPGSSIMPGKVNPVIAESTAMACYQVIGCEATVAAAAQAGQLELNVMMPVIADNLLSGLDLLANAVANLRDRCVAGIEVDEERCRAYAESSVAIATILNPVVGYETGAEVVNTALAEGKSIRRVLEEKRILPPERIEEIFDLRRWTEPGLLGE
ncbi:MAG: aspartate ammonia-lyase, partial [Candidatus Eisenbacteria bacterium]|nr:aspartate ammonia-lyase [Candidatus Latescibacterota bacterium]MBD3301478.1 aspartate ammonia-lyase [Candidatus Eisenbacteria bacterium]